MANKAGGRLTGKQKVFLSLVPALALVTVLSSALLLHWRGQHGRLAREKKGRMLALTHIERARERVERSEKYARLPGVDFEEIDSFADEAVKSASNAMARAPESEEARRIRGRALELSYKFDEARDDYAACLELHPESPARFHLGLLETRQLARARLAEMKTAAADLETMRKRAREPLRRYQAPSPDMKFDIDWKYRSICTMAVAYALGDYKELSKNGNAVESYDDVEWIGFYLLGLANLELKQDEEAVNNLEKAVKISPGTADPHAWLGLALERSGRRAEAISELTTALQADPHFLEAYLVRGTLLYEDGRFADARADFDACARLRPSLAEVHLKLGIAAHESWSRGGRVNEADLAAAEEAFTKYIAASQDPAGRLWRARTRMERKNCAGAEADLSTLPAASQVEACELRAEAYEAMGQWAKAEKDCTLVAEKAPDAARAAQALRRRARVRARDGRLPDALADYDTLLARDPKDASLHAEKAETLSQAGRFDDALAATAAGIAENPGSAPLHALRAEVFLKKEDAAAAIREATEAFSLDPQLAGALVTRGRAFLKTGRAAEAAADWKRAIELRPDLQGELAPLIEEAGR